jgi:nucleoside-diphosphate-sugar epimerase
MLLELAAAMPAYRDRARNVRLVERSGSEFYGKGYQDIQTRVPRIDNTRGELGWQPRVTLRESLEDIMLSYAPNIGEAGRLIDEEERPAGPAPAAGSRPDEHRG